MDEHHGGQAAFFNEDRKKQPAKHLQEHPLTSVNMARKWVLLLLPRLRLIRSSRLRAGKCSRQGQRAAVRVQASSSTVPQPVPMDATLATEGSQQGKTVVRVQAKQSGVKGVSWRNNCWDARWYEGAKRKHRAFFVHRYMESSGKGYQEADAEALRDAIAFRESLIKDGVIEAASASRQAGIRGVSWSNRAWLATIQVKGKTISGGRFRPQDDTPEEIERARLAAVERRRQLELEHFQIQRKEAVDPSKMQKKRESGVTGVSWDSRGLAWRSQMRLHGQNITKNFAPKDMSDESIEASSSTVPQPAPMDATLATEGSQQGKTVVRVLAKRSGVRGVSWHSGHNCWQVQWREGGKKKNKKFPVPVLEADAEALREAIAFRESLVKDGVIQIASASHQARIKGVHWSHGTWQVQIKVEGKAVHGGRFRPQDDSPEEIERARLAAVERRRQLELEHFQVQRKEAVDPSERQKKRESGVTGVTWDFRGLAWRSAICMKGNSIEKTFQPKDMADESVEAARLEAVQHRRDLERRRDAGKASS